MKSSNSLCYLDKYLNRARPGFWYSVAVSFILSGKIRIIIMSIINREEQFHEPSSQFFSRSVDDPNRRS
jgi:hypothetical protein